LFLHPGLLCTLIIFHKTVNNTEKDINRSKYMKSNWAQGEKYLSVLICLTVSQNNNF
jgi:hypothetical protein